MDPSNRSRRKKWPADARAPDAAPGPLVVAEVPLDRNAFEKALFLLQPLWARAGGYVLIFVVCLAVGSWATARWPDASKGAFRLVVAVPAGVLFVGLWSLRRSALRRQVDHWVLRSCRTGYQRIELDEEGIVLGGERVPWSDVSEAAEVDYAEATFLAVRAHGWWSILPAAHITRGDFDGARSLLMRKLDDRLRVVIV